MPRQGHFAKSTKTKQLNNFKVKQRRQGQTINNEQLTDFLLVRFALTAKKHIDPAARETVQRFLIEVGDELLAKQGDLQQIVTELLLKLNSRVPWQFYYQLLPSWALVQRFLQKEVPAIPLAQTLRITKTVSPVMMEKMIAELLVNKIAAMTFLNQPAVAASKKEQVTAMLLATIYHDHQLDWAKVQALLKPFSFTIADQLDEGTKKWLAELKKAEIWLAFTFRTC